MASRLRLSPVMAGAMMVTVVTLALSVALTARPRAGTVRSPARFAGARTVIPMPSLLPAARLVSPVRVAILRDDAAAGYYGGAPTLDRSVGAWRDALRAAGAEPIIVRPGALASLRGVRVIVVPSSPCLTIAAREALAAARSRGQGIIATGLAGTHDAGCRTIGYGLIVQLTGAGRVDVLEKREMVYVTFPDGSPLAVGMPPGARIGIDPAGHVALRLPGRDAYYSDYSLRPLPARGQELMDGAVGHSSSDGRVVYWGFDVRDVAGMAWDRAILALLVRNSVAWAAGQPLAAIAPWPHGRRAAASIAQDVEDQFANARYALDSLEAAGVRSTFFLTSDLARRHTRLTRAMAAAGEVGTHGENHRLLGGMPADSQAARLHTTQRDLKRLIGREVSGLRPPEEQFDRATLRVWLDAGGQYVFGTTDSRSAAPELLPVGRDTVVMLGRVTADDFGAFPNAAADTVFFRGYERMRDLGGLYLLSYHSQRLSRPEHVPALARVARALAADSTTWLVPAGEVAEWWRARADLDVRATSRGPGAVEVVVRNRAPRPLAGAVLRVFATPSGRGDAGSGPLLITLPEIPARGVWRRTLTTVRP